MTRVLVIVLAIWCAEAVAADPGNHTHARPHAETLARACSGCHGNGENEDRPIPSLAEMAPADFIQAMRDFKSGKRVSSIMNRIAKGYEDADFLAMADFFSRGH